jgi:membrane-associated phospholipid phosphatase
VQVAVLVLAALAAPRLAWAGDEPSAAAVPPLEATDQWEEFPRQWESGLRTAGDDTLYLLTSPLRLTTQDALVGGGVLLGIAGLSLLDTEIRDVAKHRQSDTLGEAASGIAALGYAPVLLGLNLGAIAIGEGIREYSGDAKLLDTALIATESQLLTLGFSEGLAYAIGRSRPKQSKDPFDLQFGHDSFPSAHTSQAFAVAAVVADRWDQPVGVIAYGLAGLVGVARLVQNEHWASDVVAGAALGWAVGTALSRRHETPHHYLDFFPLADPGTKTYGLVIHGRF